MRKFAAILMIGLCLPGCASFSKWFGRKKSVEPPLPPQLVGSVALVNERLRFVLIDVDRAVPLEPGQALKTFRNGQESAVLSVTLERKRPFVSADISAGTPRRGDEVYQ